MANDILLGQHPLLQPQNIRRGIIAPIENAFVADQIFTKTGTDALSIKYLKDADVDSTGHAIYDMAPEIGEASRFPRIGFSETEAQEFIRKYGIEARISYEMQRFANQYSPIVRAFNKVQKAVLNTVDKMAYRVATNQWGSGTDQINTVTVQSGKHWDESDGSGLDNFVANFLDGLATLESYGYQADTVVMNPVVFNALAKNKNFRETISQIEKTVTPLGQLKQRLVDYMGVTVIIDPNFVSPTGVKDSVLMLERGTIGEIADAIPLTTDSYNIDEELTTIVRAMRFTAAYLTDPRAIVLFQDVLSTI